MAWAWAVEGMQIGVLSSATNAVSGYKSSSMPGMSVVPCVRVSTWSNQGTEVSLTVDGIVIFSQSFDSVGGTRHTFAFSHFHLLSSWKMKRACDRLAGGFISDAYMTFLGFFPLIFFLPVNIQLTASILQALTAICTRKLMPSHISTSSQPYPSWPAHTQPM